MKRGITKNIVMNEGGIFQSLMMAKSFITSAEFIHGDGFSSGDHLYSFHLLITNALELLPKIYILKKSKNKNNIQALMSEITKHGHNLVSLYNACPDLMKSVGIQNILFKKSPFVTNYQLVLNNKRRIYIIDSESVRFGLFSKKPNVLFRAYDTHAILQLARNIFNFVSKI